jgi:hypothetical protein
MRIAFAVEDLGRGGGQIMIVKQANGLAATGRHEVFLVVASDERALLTELNPKITVLPQTEATDLPEMDLVLATWWGTGLWFTQIPSRGYGQFAQSLEDRFFSENDRIGRAWASSVQLSGLPTITEASWIQEWMARLAPSQPTTLARNGIDKQIFTAAGRPERLPEAPLRVLVEGTSAWFKGTRIALEAVASTNIPIDLTYVSSGEDWVDQDLRLPKKLSRYRRLHGIDHEHMAELMRSSDVLIKLSTVEGMPGPPLEAMHCGATVIATPVRGIEEYATHGYNCALVPFGDHVAAARWLERLWRYPALLARLEQGALATAANWPSDEQSAARFEEGVRTIADLHYQPGAPPDKPEAGTVVGVWEGVLPPSRMPSWRRTRHRLWYARHMVANHGIRYFFNEVTQRLLGKRW